MIPSDLLNPKPQGLLHVLKEIQYVCVCQCVYLAIAAARVCVSAFNSMPIGVKPTYPYS